MTGVPPSKTPRRSLKASDGQCLLVSKKGMGKYLKGNIDDEVAVTSLASKDVVGAAPDETVGQRTRITSIVVGVGLNDNTGVAGAGPLVVGVAHSDYSDAEIEEYLETTGQWDEGDLVAQEHGRRKVRILGEFPGLLASEVLWNGAKRKFKLNWILNIGDGLRLFAYNAGDQSWTGTGTPAVTLNGHANLFPTG